MSIIKQIGTILAINGDGYGIQTHEIMPWKGIELDHFSTAPYLVGQARVGLTSSDYRSLVLTVEPQAQIN